MSASEQGGLTTTTNNVWWRRPAISQVQVEGNNKKHCQIEDNIVHSKSTKQYTSDDVSSEYSL